MVSNQSDADFVKEGYAEKEKKEEEEITVVGQPVASQVANSVTNQEVKPVLTVTSQPIKSTANQTVKPVKQEKERVQEKKKEEKKEKVKEEPVKEEPINWGNYVSFNRTSIGTTIDQLNKEQQRIAEEIMDIVRNGENEIERYEHNLSYDEWDVIRNAIDNTYYYWRGRIFTAYKGKTKTLEIYTKYSRKDLRQSEELETLVSRAVYSCVSSGMREREAVIAINNYACRLLTYDENYGDLYTAFTTGYGRCSSYAYVVQAMCKFAGIPCQYVSGYAKVSSGWGNHAWNRVLIGGTWYYLDACWNDSSGNKYLLSEELWANHSL